MQLITPKDYNLFTLNAFACPRPGLGNVGNILISCIIFVFFVGCSEPCDGQSWYDTLYKYHYVSAMCGCFFFVFACANSAW